MPVQNEKSIRELLEKASIADLKIIASAISPYVKGGTPPQILNLSTSVEILDSGGKYLTVNNRDLANALSRVGLANVDNTGKVLSLHGDMGTIQSVVIPTGRGDTAGGESFIIVPKEITTGDDMMGSLDLIRSTAISKVSEDNDKKFENKKKEGFKNGTMLWRITNVTDPSGTTYAIPILLEKDFDATNEKRENAKKQAEETGKEYRVQDEYRVVEPPCYLEPDCPPADRSDQTVAILSKLNSNVDEQTVRNQDGTSVKALADAGFGVLKSIGEGISTVQDKPIISTGRKINALLAKVSGLVKEYTDDGGKVHDLAGGVKKMTVIARQIMNYGGMLAGATESLDGMIEGDAEKIVGGAEKVAENLTKEFVIVKGTDKIGTNVATVIVGPPPDKLSSSAAKKLGTVPKEMSMAEWEALKKLAPASTGDMSPTVKTRDRVSLNNEQRAKITNEISKRSYERKFNRIKNWIEFAIYFAIYGLPLLGYTRKSRKKEEELNRLKNESREKGCMEGPYVVSNGTICLPIEGNIEIYDENTNTITEIAGLPEVLIGPSSDLNELPGRIPFYGTQPPIDIYAQPNEEISAWDRFWYNVGGVTEEIIEQIENLGLGVLEKTYADFKSSAEILIFGQADSTIYFAKLRFDLRRKRLFGEITQEQLEEGLIEIKKKELEVEEKNKEKNKDESRLLEPKTDPTFNSSVNLAMEVTISQQKFEDSKRLVDSLVNGVGIPYENSYSPTPNVALNSINSDTTFVTNASDMFVGDNTPVVTPIGISDSQCFSMETFIKTETSYVRISDLKPGDTVISFDNDGNLYLDIVSNIFHYENKVVSKYIFENNNWLEATSEHPVLTQNGIFVEIGKLSIGDSVVQMDGTFLKIIEIHKSFKNCDVFNLEVLTNHTYIANGVRVHNKISAEYVSEYAADVRKTLDRFRLEQKDAEGKANDYMNWFCAEYPEMCGPDGYPKKTPPPGSIVPTDPQSNRIAGVELGAYSGVINEKNYVWSPGSDEYENSRIGKIGPPVPPELRKKK